MKRKFAGMLAVIFVLQMLVCQVYADSEGWRKVLYLTDDGKSDSISIGITMKKTTALSCAIQFHGTDSSGTTGSMATLRFSTAGKLLFRDGSAWISASDENTSALIRADFAAGTQYQLVMNYHRATGLIEWMLDGSKIGESTTSYLGAVCDHVRLMITEADMEQVEWSLTSVAPGYDGVSVIKSYEPTLTNAQGAENWYFCEYGKEDSRELTLDESGRWGTGEGSYPYIDTETEDIFPANSTEVGFTFVAPKTGTVALVGDVKMPEKSGDATVLASIYKNRTKKWDGSVSSELPASYYLILPLEVGEQLHFKVGSNGSNTNDYTYWKPVVHYIDRAYESDDPCTYWQDCDGTRKALSCSSSASRYYAEDPTVYIARDGLCVNPQYAIVKRCTVTEAGRHRIYGEFLPEEAIQVQITKNDTVVWKQQFPGGETGVLDIRALLAVNDVVDVKISTSADSTTCEVKDFYIEYYVSTAFSKASTTVGHSYTVESEVSLGDLVVNPGDTKVSFYSQRFSRSLPMKQDGDRWVSTVANDTGYFSQTTAYPGKHHDSVMELLLDKGGIINIEGNMTVRDISDGVVSKILLNDQVVWSSRVGGERVVRYDEPYDISYFSNRADVTLRVQQGDRLAFSFNQWRLTDNDQVDISDVRIKYIAGSVLSETTSWKLADSIVVDMEKRTITKNGVEYNHADVIMHKGKLYVQEADASVIFGGNVLTGQIMLNGLTYYPIRENAEGIGNTVVWAAEKLAIIHSGIPVRFGWNELSEINTHYVESAARYKKKLFDTYDDGTTPNISLTDGNSDINYGVAGGLKPQVGYTAVSQQSNALVLAYYEDTNLLANTSKIDISCCAGEKVTMLDMDIFIPSANDFSFTMKDVNGVSGAQLLISANGWAAAYFGDGGADWLALDKATAQSDTTYPAADFTFGTWNNIKLVADGNLNYIYFYLNNTRIHRAKQTGLATLESIDQLQLVNHSVSNGKTVPLYIDDLKLATSTAFINRATLTEANLASMNVQLYDTFEIGDDLDVPISWNGDNQLRPLGGTAYIVAQNNAARVFSGIDGAGVEHIRFDVQKYVGDGTVPVLVELDVNTFADDIIVLSERNYWGYGNQAVISPKGYLASTYGKWIDDEEQQASMRAFAGQAASEQIGMSFEQNSWHKIQMLYEDEGKKCSLFVDNKLVNVQNKETGEALEAFQITVLTADTNQAGDAKLDIDNLKVSQINRFYVDELLFKDGSKAVSEKFLPDADCYLYINAVNVSDTDEEVQIIIAQYDSNDTLLCANFEHTLNLKGNSGIKNSGDILFHAHADAEKIKIFAWRKGTIYPLIDALTVLK